MAKKDGEINNIISNFAGRTSMHGLGSLSTAGSRKAKVFWSLVCLSSMGMFCFMFSRIVKRYLEFNVVVNVEEVRLFVGGGCVGGSFDGQIVRLGHDHGPKPLFSIPYSLYGSQIGYYGTPRTLRPGIFFTSFGTY